MTEDILNAAIQKLRGLALEQFALAKDALHQPANADTVSNISTCAINMAQLEGAMITLQQYADSLKTRTPAEIAATEPEVPPQEELKEEAAITDKELAERSPTFRKSQGIEEPATKKRKRKSKSES